MHQKASIVGVCYFLSEDLIRDVNDISCHDSKLEAVNDHYRIQYIPMGDHYPPHHFAGDAQVEISGIHVGGHNSLLLDEGYSINEGASVSERFDEWAENSMRDDETDVGPSRLFAILEDAIPRPGENRPMTNKEVQTRKETVEHTWDQVRRWLYSHPDSEARSAAAYVRGQADASPLHMMCKLDNPPHDIIAELVAAAPETVSWVDSHGWLPLHHACANGASTEVLKILAEAYPEGKTAQDNQNRTPLHFYATRKPDNPNAMAANVVMLSDTGAAELPDRGGMLPMHYACAYGTCPQVLKVLAEAYPDSLTAKENKGRTPMHLAMVNAHRDASPGVISFLLESGSASTVNMRDHEGYLPLHLLALGLKGYRADEPEQRANVSACLSMYLAAEPIAPADFLTALQDLPDWLQDVAVVSPHVRSILNEKIVQRFPTSILMLDGYFLLAIIVCFELATRNHIDIRLGTPPAENTTKGSLVVLFIGGSYFLLRELVQIVSLWSLGSLSSWFFDTTNWLDTAVITVVFYFTILMTDDSLVAIGNETFRNGVAVAKGVLWCAVIYFLKSTLVDFAVFVGGVFYVVQRLTAFMLAVCVILLAFAQMFFIVYIRSPICTPFSADVATNLTNNNYNSCEFPHCTFPHSLFKVYTMMLGEIGDETRYANSTVAQIIYVAFAFLVVILLSNLLIAIVTDSYEIIQNDRAAIVFWSNRLDFVAEMDAISYGIRSRLSCLGGGDRDGVIKHVQEGPSGEGIVITEDSANAGGLNRIMRETWKQIMVLFDSSLYEEVDLNPSHIEFWCYLGFRLVTLVIVIPLWLIIGAATAGWLWPPQVREYLFVQKETAISRAELERQKLEQLQKIQIHMKSLKTDLQKEMAVDRGDMIRLKGEVEAVQSELLSDLQQVKELMTTLLDMGRRT